MAALAPEVYPVLVLVLVVYPEPGLPVRCYCTPPAILVRSNLLSEKHRLMPATQPPQLL